MRSRFDEQLALLNKELIVMGAQCEQVISVAAQTLLSGDMSEIDKVISLDTDIDHKEREIESMCLKLLLQQQPVAKDLRLISSALKMITDMERIGDQASDIVEIAGFLKGNSVKNFQFISDMSKEATKMVTESVDAFVKHDLELADAVIKQDDVVDKLFDDVKRALIDMIRDNTQDGEAMLDILMIAKYFERIADHAVNIAEWVIFSVTGRHDEGMYDSVEPDEKKYHRAASNLNEQ